ncbi:hypothetical protein ACFC4G_08980 [Streptomyces sp. NPDC056002]|uniref:hypothetical protein n=1 Tax=Streptomyces sp. NPDC056002 TaxID=3345675 RepID=UPI0035D853E6
MLVPVGLEAVHLRAAADGFGGEQFGVTALLARRALVQDEDAGDATHRDHAGPDQDDDAVRPREAVDLVEGTLLRVRGRRGHRLVHDDHAGLREAGADRSGRRVRFPKAPAG